MPRGMYPIPPPMARPPAIPPPRLAVIPPIPPPQVAPPQVENRVINVIGLEEKKSKDEETVEFEVMPMVKRTRGDHGKEPMEEDEEP